MGVNVLNDRMRPLNSSRARVDVCAAGLSLISPTTDAFRRAFLPTKRRRAKAAVPSSPSRAVRASGSRKMAVVGSMQRGRTGARGPPWRALTPDDATMQRVI